MTCLVCDSDRVQTKHLLFDDRYGFPGKFFLWGCSQCGHHFLDGKFTPAQITELYSRYYPRSSVSVESYKPHKKGGRLSGWLKGEQSETYCWVPPNVRILDVGCGFGESLGYHKERGCDVYGVETDENVRRIADRFGFKIKIGLFDAKDYEPESFDYVTMNQVIEHVSSPVETLRGIATVLKKNGVLVIGTPNPTGWGVRTFGRKWVHWHTPYHLHLFSRDSLRIAASRAGFAIERLQTLTSSEWLYYQLVHLITYPEEGRASMFWAPKATPWNWRRMFLRRCMKIVHVLKVTHLTTRIMDGLGMGDSFLVLMRKR